jgi:hypothetical protein
MTLEDEGRVVKFLIRDRDTKFVGPFDEVLTSIGARVVKTPIRAPSANAFAERFARKLPRSMGHPPGHARAALRSFMTSAVYGSLTWKVLLRSVTRPGRFATCRVRCSTRSVRMVCAECTQWEGA